MQKISLIIDQYISSWNGFLETVLFWDVFFFTDQFKFPLVIFILFAGASFTTLKMNFVNIRLFKHAWLVTFGKLYNKTAKGEVSHFQALSTALSATVGLGNIAGVAIAISVGGPGATFWMIVMSFIGMSMKFTECSLALMYRQTEGTKNTMGGPMVYLKEGLKDLNLPRLGRFLTIVFCVCCIAGSFGGGIAFQVNQSLNAISLSIPSLSQYSWVYALVISILVALVILGGVKRIAEVASHIVPTMCGIYLLMSLVVLANYYYLIPQTLLSIVQEAFNFKAGIGGFFGVLVVGFQRAALSSEVGFGSSPIAHSVAKASHPIEEGSVALLEPFIDTAVICTITALVILVTGVSTNPEFADLVVGQKGAALTSLALKQVHSFFPYILSFVVFMFAFSTIISWSFYGERCFSYLFGESRSIIYKLLVFLMIFMGALSQSTTIMNFCDFMAISLVIPNTIGIILLSGKVKKLKNEYLSMHNL